MRLRWSTMEMHGHAAQSPTKRQRRRRKRNLAIEIWTKKLKQKNANRKMTDFNHGLKVCYDLPFILMLIQIGFSQLSRVTFLIGFLFLTSCFICFSLHRHVLIRASKTGVRDALFLTKLSFKILFFILKVKNVVCGLQSLESLCQQLKDYYTFFLTSVMSSCIFGFYFTSRFLY